MAGGRPTKRSEEKRSEHLGARTTIAEKAYASQQAQISGFSDLSDYVRHRTLEYSAPPPAAHRRTDPALVSAINNLWREFQAIGRNVNQITRNKNAGRYERIAWENIEKLMQERSDQAKHALEQILDDHD